MKPAFQTAGEFQAGKLILLCLLLFGLVFWTFFPSLPGDFIDVDDGVFVNRNPHINLTLANVAWAFGHTECANWLPLTLWSFMLDHQLYGFKSWGFHLTNVLLHAVNTVLVFLVLRRMTGATWRSLIVAGLFGLHPLRVESVAWISERKDVLSVLFWMLTLWAYVRYAQGRLRVESRKSSAGNGSLVLNLRPLTFDYFLALVFFALSLMSKPMVVTLPGVLLLLDYWPLGRWPQKSLRGLLLEKAPFFLLSAIVSVVTCVAQRNAGMMSAVFTGLSLSFGARLENALVSYGRYLGKLFWPVDLCALYPYPGHWPAQKILLAGLLVLGLSIFVFFLRRQRPYLLTGWLWYLGALVPVLGLVPVGAQAMADRYSYLPSLGILIVLVWGTCQVSRGWHYQSLVLGAAGGVLALVCIGLTRHQLGFWRDEVSLWRRAVAVTENNYEAHNRLGRALFSQGQFDEAVREFQVVTNLNPSFAEVYCSLGQAFAAQGRRAEAIAACKIALAIRPGFVAAHNDLADFLLRAGRMDEAMVHCRLAVEIEPDSVTAQNNFGNALALEGRFVEAVAHFQKALEVQPDNAMVQAHLGSALLRMGRLDEAILRFRAALKLQPDNAETHNNLGGALLSKGQVAEALGEFRAAVRLQPDRFEAHRNLGHALMQLGHLDEAILEFRAALLLNPDNIVASNDLVAAFHLKEEKAAHPLPAKP